MRVSTAKPRAVLQGGQPHVLLSPSWGLYMLRGEMICFLLLAQSKTSKEMKHTYIKVDILEINSQNGASFSAEFHNINLLDRTVLVLGSRFTCRGTDVRHPGLTSWRWYLPAVWQEAARAAPPC